MKPMGRAAVKDHACGILFSYDKLTNRNGL
jgi:hypothetical protein